jgi:hypothetical protein
MVNVTANLLGKPGPLNEAYIINPTAIQIAGRQHAIHASKTTQYTGKLAKVYSIKGLLQTRCSATIYLKHDQGQCRSKSRICYDVHYRSRQHLSMR